jgi:hypothetical protein
MMGWAFYFILLVLAAIGGYNIGVFVTNLKWSDRLPELRRRD